MAPDGLILTNSHVVGGASQVGVTAVGNPLGFEQKSAVIIASVEPDSPAGLAPGLDRGDIMVALDGSAVTGADDLIGMLAGDKIDRSVAIETLRGGKLETGSAIPSEPPRKD